MITFNVNFQTFLPVMHYIYKVFYIMERSGTCCPRPWNSPLCIIKQEFRSTLFCLKTKGDKSSLYSRNKKRFYSWHPQHSNKPPFGIHHFSCRFLHKLAITAWTARRLLIPKHQIILFLGHEKCNTIRDVVLASGATTKQMSIFRNWTETSFLLELTAPQLPCMFKGADSY